MSKKDKKREELRQDDMSLKKDGVTSSFSAATGDPGKYSGEDIEAPEGSTGNDADKVAPPSNDEPAM